MKRIEMSIPVASCDKCGGTLKITIGLKECLISCSSCEYEFNVIEELKEQATHQSKESKIRIKAVTKEASNAIKQAKSEMPKSKDELKKAIRDPKHPFTAAVLAGLIIVAMELSGFGIFAALTWILGNLILNPAGWVLIPVLVAIAVIYRNKFKKEKLAELRDKLEELDRMLKEGKFTKEEHAAMRNDAIKNLLD